MIDESIESFIVGQNYNLEKPIELEKSFATVLKILALNKDISSHYDKKKIVCS